MIVPASSLTPEYLLGGFIKQKTAEPVTGQQRIFISAQHLCMTSKKEG
jgi:hypothetical protein